MQEILAALAEWEDAEDTTADLDLLTGQIRPYLGARATERLVHSGAGARAQLLGEVEPVLAQFLGKRAAARLISQILDRVLARS